MPFTRPTLQELTDRARADIAAGLGTVAVVRRSVEDALAVAIAGAAHSLHEHIVFSSRQIFPDQADGDFLLRWASLYGLATKPATFSTLQFSGTGEQGAVLPAGAEISAGGLTFTTTADATPTDGAFVVEAKALLPGASGNLAPLTSAKLVTASVGIGSNLKVASTVIEGENVEPIESLRERLIDRIKVPPSGGKTSDYISYARSVSGVARAWVFPNWLGEGTVGVSFVEENNKLPSAAKVAEVQAAIDAVKPVSSEVFVFAPDPKVIDFEIALKPNTEAVRQAVAAELADLFEREAQVSGAWKSVTERYAGSLALSKVSESISLAAGEQEHKIRSPKKNIEIVAGGLIQLGNLTFLDAS